MSPARLAVVDRLRADEAARDVIGRLEDLGPAALGSEAELLEALDLEGWRAYVWLWTAAVTGRDPLDTSPLQPWEVVLICLELI